MIFQGIRPSFLWDVDLPPGAVLGRFVDGS